MPVDLLDVAGNAHAIMPHHRAELEIFLHRHADEGASPLRHVGDPEAHDILGGAAEEGLAVEANLTTDSNNPAERAQCRRLAGTVRAEQRHDVAFVECEVEAVKGLVLTIKRTQLAHLEHHCRGARGLPK